jgi:hypothetical protein
MNRGRQSKASAEFEGPQAKYIGVKTKKSNSALGFSFLYSFSFSQIATQITDCYRSKEGFLSLINFTRGPRTLNRDRELRSDPPVQHLNNRSLG